MEIWFFRKQCLCCKTEWVANLSNFLGIHFLVTFSTERLFQAIGSILEKIWQHCMMSQSQCTETCYADKFFHQNILSEGHQATIYSLKMFSIPSARVYSTAVYFEVTKQIMMILVMMLSHTWNKRLNTPDLKYWDRHGRGLKEHSMFFIHPPHIKALLE